MINTYIRIIILHRPAKQFQRSTHILKVIVQKTVSEPVFPDTASNASNAALWFVRKAARHE